MALTNLHFFQNTKINTPPITMAKLINEDD